MEKMDHGRKMLDFIANSPSCFHVIANLKEKFAAAGFAELSEGKPWDLRLGGSYYVVRNDSSLIAFRLPAGASTTGIQGFHVVASHSDSPTFQVKESAEMETEKHYIRLNTEKYGGLIQSSWLDRPLSVAGRIVVRTGETNGRAKLATKLVNIDRDLLVIPNVASHINREINKGMEYDPQIDLIPLFADCAEVGEENIFLRLIAEAAGVAPEDILGQDLFLYVRDRGRVFGAREEFMLSPRLDDLQCVYAATEAFAQTAPKEYISFCAVFDNEEVGSSTMQGADSTFLEDVLARVTEALGADRETYLRWISEGFLISADNAHAVHPNHPEKSDPTNRPYLNGGIVIKHSGLRKYTTDAVSAARMKDLCTRANVPFQSFANRSDLMGGSTLGKISASHVSILSVDVGLPQLAMHSAMETGGMRDTEYAVKVFGEFFKE